LQNPERFDAQLCDLFASHHSSGLDVFAAPRNRTNVPEVNVAVLDVVFDTIARRYDLILIDLPVAWSAWTSDILANADGVIITGINTIPGLRQIAEVLAVIRSGRREASQMAVVINRYEPTMIGRIARQKHAQAVLGGEQVFYVRNDAAAMAESVNTGAPLALSAKFRRTVREIGAIAGFCAELKSIRAASP
jgi:pilus assembly protein CpaE